MKTKVTIRKNGSRRIEHITEGPSMTETQYAEESDINNIMDRYAQTGIPPVSRGPGFSFDNTTVADLATAHQLISEAQENFLALPAKTRALFDNDPKQLVEFVQDESNRDAALKLGLINPPPAPEPAVKVEITNPLPPTSST